MPLMQVFFFSSFDNKQTSASHLCLCSIYLIISVEPAVQYDETMKESLISLAGNRETKQMEIGLDCEEVKN